MEEKRLEMLKQLAAGIAAQFGSNCEVVIHDVSSNHPDHSIVHPCKCGIFWNIRL